MYLKCFFVEGLAHASYLFGAKGEAAGLAPIDNRESAILVTLNPGPYTAIVRGKNLTTGQALIELYDLD